MNYRIEMLSIDGIISNESRNIDFYSLLFDVSPLPARDNSMQTAVQWDKNRTINAGLYCDQ